jgi:hypothetical protein
VFPCPLGVGVLDGIEATPNRLAVDAVLAGEVADTLARARPAATRWSADQLRRAQRARRFRSLAG